MATPKATAKNNSKDNNCTLECNRPSSCTELLLKFEHKKYFLEFSGLQERNNKSVLSTCLASWRNIPSFSAHKIQGRENKTLISRTKKSASKKCDFSEPWSMAFPSSLLRVPRLLIVLMTTHTKSQHLFTGGNNRFPYLQFRPDDQVFQIFLACRVVSHLLLKAAVEISHLLWSFPQLKIVWVYPQELHFPMVDQKKNFNSNFLQKLHSRPFSHLNINIPFFAKIHICPPSVLTNER